MASEIVEKRRLDLIESSRKLKSNEIEIVWLHPVTPLHATPDPHHTCSDILKHTLMQRHIRVESVCITFYFVDAACCLCHAQAV